MTKDSIVLINPTNPDPPPNYFGPPYGLSLIGAALLKEKIPVKAYDFDLQPASVMLSSIKDIIKKEKPRYIGVSIQSCTRGPVYELIRAIKAIDSSIIVILGGPFASIKYELLLRNFPVDYIVIGDGEKTLVELLNGLKNQGDLRNIKGIAFSSGGNLYRTEERRKVVDLDLLPYPAFHLFKDFDKKINSAASPRKGIPDFILGRRCTTLKNALLLLSSRGCIYNCNFCPMSGITKDKIRFHSPGYFVDMVEYYYKKYTIKKFIFGDNTFTLRRDSLMEICQMILSKGLKIKWGCMTRSDYVDSRMLKLMARAGCFEISYGVESGSEKIQRSIRKNLDLTVTKASFRMTKQAGIRSILMLMVGNLGESSQTIRETLNYVRDLDPDNILVKIVKVYPGTEIHDLFEKKGLIKKDYYLGSEFKPPTFTIQHSEGELERFASMINTRRAFVEINNSCNNNCLPCNLNRKRKGKTFEEIKKALILASTRAERIILCGGEPFLRKDIFKILDYCDKLGIHHLYIYTNARRFLYRAFAKKAGETKLSKAIIEFFGFGDFHDKIARCRGAFFQTVKGIKNLKQFARNIKIEAKIFTLASNYKQLIELTNLLINLGTDDFSFVFLKDAISPFKINNSNIPLMHSVECRLKDIAQVLKQSDRQFFIEGMPFCILQELKGHLKEAYYPFDELINMDKGVINCRQKRTAQKLKFDFCSKCRDEKLCEGVWKKYFRCHGKSEFKPY